MQKYEQNDLLVATAAATLQWALIEHAHTRTYTCLNAPNISQARLFYRNRTTPICMTKYAQVETNNYLSYSCTNLVNYANIYDRDKQHYKLNSTFGSVVVVGAHFTKGSTFSFKIHNVETPLQLDIVMESACRVQISSKMEIYLIYSPQRLCIIIKIVGQILFSNLDIATS